MPNLKFGGIKISDFKAMIHEQEAKKNRGIFTFMFL